MEDGKRIFRIILNILIPAGTIVLVCTLGPWLLRFFMPFVVGWCIALICNPLVKFLEKRLKLALSSDLDDYLGQSYYHYKQVVVLYTKGDSAAEEKARADIEAAMSG